MRNIDDNFSQVRPQLIIKMINAVKMFETDVIFYVKIFCFLSHNFFIFKLSPISS